MSKQFADTGLDCRDNQNVLLCRSWDTGLGFVIGDGGKWHFSEVALYLAFVC